MPGSADIELLLRAIAIGDNLVRIADSLGEDAAADHISSGLEMLRLRADIALDLGQSLFDER